jgi:hypothetical protein
MVEADETATTVVPRHRPGRRERSNCGPNMSWRGAHDRRLHAIDTLALPRRRE